jgi:alpha 1,2-mannosyltransferase
MEDRFNKKFNYPYVFLNEEAFSEEFKRRDQLAKITLPPLISSRSRVTALTDSPVQFGLIPKEHWFQPKW